MLKEHAQKFKEIYMKGIGYQLNLHLTSFSLRYVFKTLFYSEFFYTVGISLLVFKVGSILSLPSNIDGYTCMYLQSKI